VKTAFLAIVLVLALAQSVWAASFEEDRHVQELIVRISHETLNSEYEKAITSTHNLINRYPKEPFPRFLLSSIYMYILRSYWDFPADDRYASYKKKFSSAAADAKKACDEYPVQNATIYFLRGMVLGTEGMVHLQDKEYLDSYSKGKSAVAALEKSLEIDPANYDAYLGLGMFEYYCSKFTGAIKVLAWLIGFSGNSEKGIEYVTKAMTHGKYSENAAKVFLAHAYIQYEDKLDEGVELAKNLRARYPRNFTFIEYFLRAARKLPPERATEGIRWIDSYVKTPNWKDQVILFVPFNLEMVDYVEASLYLARNDYAAARDLLEPVSACNHHVDEFSTEVNLALLYVYAKTANHDKAREIYSHIMNHKSINNSHSKAKDILRG
jgi:outer membrane protein assembly factor BamD (BamD/ComL family)